MATLLKLLIWLLRGIVFFFLFGLALKNSGTMTLHFFFGRELTAPAAVVLLAVFALGVAIGLTAALVGTFRRKKNKPASR